MKLLKNLYRLFNTLSLDVCAGAVCCCLFFADVAGSPVHAPALVVLALSVWLIYTVDHLRDASMMRHQPSQHRHRFHLVYSKPLRAAVIFGSIANAAMLFLLPIDVILAGTGLITAIGLYLLFMPFFRKIKEIVVALFYTAGILTPLTEIVFTYQFALLALCFFLLALMNLVLLSYYERRQDAKDDMPSIVISWGEGAARVFLHILFVLISLGFVFSGFAPPFFVVWLMASLHYAILVFEPLFRRNNAFRLVSEASFLIPLVFILLS